MYRKHQDEDKELDKYPQWMHHLADTMIPHIKSAGKFTLCCALLFIACTLWVGGCNNLSSLGEHDQYTWAWFGDWSISFVVYMLAIVLGYYPITKGLQFLNKLLS